MDPMQAGNRSPTTIRWLPWLLLAVLPILVSCAQPGLPHDWQSPLFVDHPLVGKVWHSRSGELVQQTSFPADLVQELATARYLILGEKHDNPDHHVLQRQLVEQWLSQRLLSRLVLEMLDDSSSAALAGLPAQTFGDSDELADYLNWDRTGWNWEFYGPLLQSAHRASLPVYAGNISPERVGQVHRQPAPPELAGVLAEPITQRLAADMDTGHCGQLPQAQVPGMVHVQQARDHSMARQLISPDDDNGLALLITGNYHARHDLGVPNYLLALDANLQRHAIISLSLMEVQPGQFDPASYLDQFSSQVAYDYLWFTPATPARDYCASLQDSGSPILP